MDLSLRERFAWLGPIRAVDRPFCGSSGVVALRLLPDRSTLKSVDAALALARRGLPLLQAKRVIEDLLAAGSGFVELPIVDDPPAVMAELADAGILSAVTQGRDARSDDSVVACG